MHASCLIALGQRLSWWHCSVVSIGHVFCKLILISDLSWCWYQFIIFSHSSHGFPSSWYVGCFLILFWTVVSYVRRLWVLFKFFTKKSPQLSLAHRLYLLLEADSNDNSLFRAMTILACLAICCSWGSPGSLPVLMGGGVSPDSAA